MALPEIATPTYTLTIPSTKKKVKYRPFLVKEQKILILAMENEDQEQILDAITNTIKACLITKIDMTTLALFDIEYLFLQIRARSISEELKLKITCPDDGETQVDVSFLANDVNVEVPDGHTNIIKLGNDITLEMRYPNLAYFSAVNFAGDDVDPYDLVAQCIDRVYQREDDCGTFTFKEARQWVDTLSTGQFENIQTFFNTMPSLRHTLKVKNPKTGVDNEITIQGLADFFG